MTEGTESTPLERVIEQLRRSLSESGLGPLPTDEAERNWMIGGIASDVLGAARLPEQLDTASELRTANLIALSSLLQTFGSPGLGHRVYAMVIRRLGIHEQEGM